MRDKSIPAPVVAVVVVLVVVGVAIFLYKGATGGTVGVGVPGRVVTDPRDIYKK